MTVSVARGGGIRGSQEGRKRRHNIGRLKRQIEADHALDVGGSPVPPRLGIERANSAGGKKNPNGGYEPPVQERSNLRPDPIRIVKS